MPGKGRGVQLGQDIDGFARQSVDGFNDFRVGAVVGLSLARLNHSFHGSGLQAITLCGSGGAIVCDLLHGICTRFCYLGRSLIEALQGRLGPL